MGAAASSKDGQRPGNSRGDRCQGAGLFSWGQEESRAGAKGPQDWRGGALAAGLSGSWLWRVRNKQTSKPRTWLATGEDLALLLRPLFPGTHIRPSTAPGGEAGENPQQDGCGQQRGLDGEPTGECEQWCVWRARPLPHQFAQPTYDYVQLGQGTPGIPETEPLGEKDTGPTIVKKCQPP